MNVDSTPQRVSKLARRDFLAKSSVAGIGSAIGLASVPAWAANIAEKQKGLTAAAFQRYIGNRFRLSNGSQLYEVRLTEMAQRAADGARPPYVRQQPFSIFFTASKDCGFEAGTYRIAHPELGEIETFVSPVDDPKHRMTLQVIFA